MKLRILFVWVLCILILSGCTSSKPNTNEQKPSPNGIYTAESWKEIIPESCQSFNDGCNQCIRIISETGAVDASCTKMYCENYKKPVCTDPIVNESWSTAPSLQDQYVGLTIEQATELANKSRKPFRIVEVDGQPQAVTMDLVPGRLNAKVNSGVIVDLMLE